MNKNEEKFMLMMDALNEDGSVNPDVVRFSYNGHEGSFTPVGNCMTFEIDGLWGFADPDGYFATPPQYDDVILPIQRDSAKIVGVKMGEKWAITNTTGKLLTEFKYDSVQEIINGYASVESEGKWGFVNSKGEEICKLKYDEVYFFHNGKAKVFLGGEEFYINSKGNRVE